MKKNYLMTLGLALFGTLGLSAQQNLSKPQPFSQKVRSTAIYQALGKAAIPMEVKFSEDFSKFKAGSEATPDKKDIGGTQENGFAINSKYLQTPGWYGAGVYQAGGACALKMYNYSYPGYDEVYTTTGYISTPQSELFGDLEITFRAKKISTDDQFWVGLCDNDYGPVDEKRFTLTDEWQTFEFKSNKGTFNDRNVVQFAPQGDTEILIDDIVIKRAITKTQAPEPGVAINKSFEEFVATWHPTTSADKYRLNIYKKTEPTNYVAGTLSENFDQINVKADGVSIDTANPNYPKDWNINVSANGKKDMSKNKGDFNSAPRAIVLDEVGDIVETPELPAPVNEIRFWVRPSHMNMENEIFSMFSVNIWDSSLKKWIPIANMPNYFFQEGGMMYTFNADQIGLNVTKVKLEYIQNGDGHVSFAIDDLEVDYKTQLVDEPVLVDYETTDTFYVAKNVDPKHEHYYYVQALQGDLVSEKTMDVWVDAVSGLKPVVDEATNVTANSFDVSWTKFNNAREYTVDLYKAVTASEAMVDVTVLEEGFDKINDGTVELPHQEWYDTYDFADNGLCDAHWVSFQPQWAKGMIGTKGTNMWTGIPGFIASPALDLHNNGGAFSVEFTVHTMVENDSVAVMIMPNLSENASCVLVGACKGKPGLYTMTANFPEGGLESCHVAFMSYKGNPLFLDKVKIVQNLNKGERMVAPLRSVKTTENHYSFTDLPDASEYAVEVVAKTMKNYAYYSSEKSDRKFVNMNVTGVEGTLVAQPAVVGTDGGVRVSGVPAGTLVQVYNLQGQLVKSAVADGAVNVNVPQGVYLVKVDNNAVKVLVK